jgi:LPXTG-motif cell wall-anchored protein
LGSIVTRVVAALTALLTFATAAPAVADPAATPGVDLSVTVTFERPAYYAYEQIAATVTIVNDGSAPATGVTLTTDANAPFSTTTWAAFEPDGPGATVQPGEKVELPATVEPFEVVDVVYLAVEVHTADPDADKANNTARAEATITVRTTDLTATLYGDRDGDKTYDPGEALTGVAVTGEGGRPLTSISTRTDDAGRFTVPNVPEGSYALDFGVGAMWQLDESWTLEVHPGGGEQLVRAVLNSNALRATIAFDKPVYQVGDTVHEHVTLTNTGKIDLAGVTARCVEGAAPNQLSGMGWGDLVHYEAAGVAVRAGETRTFDFTDVVPPGGRLYGFISLTCWFSTAFRYDDGPAVVARADVPGGRGGTGGVLFVDNDGSGFPSPGEGVANVKVCLVGRDGTVVGRTVTGAEGYFKFTDVAANNYYLRLLGPWRLKEGIGLQVGVFDGAFLDGSSYAIEPGPNQLDLDTKPAPTMQVTPPPAKQAPPLARPQNLADTGADVVELTVLGVALLLVGSGLLFVRRRRETS